MKNISIAIILVISVSFLFSCRTNQQSNLVGTWKYIPHTEPDTSAVRLWSFFASGELEIEDISEQDTLLRIYSYNIEGSELNIYGDESVLGPYHPNPNEYRGKYWVNVLDKSYCKIEKTEHGDGSDGNAYLRVEMVKQ